MTLFMRDREKYAEGLAAGVEQGLAAGRQNVLITMLKNNFSKEQILTIGYTEEEIKQAEESLFAVN